MYLYAIPFREKFIVYRPLRRLAFIANIALVNLLAECGGASSPSVLGPHRELAGFLEKIDFFAPDPQIPEPVNPASAFKPHVAVLFPTTACNLRCIYCYASAGEKAVEMLPLATGRQAIDAVCTNAREQGRDCFTLGFHGGGEPSLARDLLERLVAHARSKELPCEVTIATNGCWTDDFRHWLLDNIDSVSLSCDGLPEVQDRQRPLADGSGSSRLVWASINAMDQRGFSYGIRLTVTDESIDSLAVSINWLCQETGCKVFQIEPAFDHGRAESAGLALSRQERFANAFLEAYDIAVAAGRHLYYSGARPWVLTHCFCQAQDTALIVGPDGFLTGCYEICSRAHRLAGDFIYGSLDENGQMSMDQGRRQNMFAKMAERRSLCRSCFCYWHCAGDCPSKTFDARGGGHLVFGPRCELNRLLTRELLIRYVSQGNGLWLGERREERHSMEVFA